MRSNRIEKRSSRRMKKRKSSRAYVGREDWRHSVDVNKLSRF